MYRRPVVPLYTAGLMVPQVQFPQRYLGPVKSVPGSMPCAGIDLTHSFQETRKATPPHLQLTRCGLMSVRCSVLHQSWTSNYWSSASACHFEMWRSRCQLLLLIELLRRCSLKTSRQSPTPKPSVTNGWVDLDLQTGEKTNGWVDLDLPIGEKCSWWRLDGYATCAEPEACEGLGAEPEDVELSLSNSEDPDDSEW